MQEKIEELDKKIQSEGWRFLGPILHYENAWKNQASVYEKKGKYIVAGFDSSGEKDFRDKISKKEAEKRVNESFKEIRKFMFKNI